MQHNQNTLLERRKKDEAVNGPNARLVTLALKELKRDTTKVREIIMHLSEGWFVGESNDNPAIHPTFYLITQNVALLGDTNKRLLFIIFTR